MNIFSKNDIKFIREEISGFFKSVLKIFIYKEKYKHSTKKILVAGGYGYGNTGDEAQCSATLELLTKRYPEYQIVNLTPNVSYSKTQHPEYMHEYASRVLFFNQGRKCNCFDFNNSLIKKGIFLLKSVLILINAYLIRADFPSFFINSNIVKFLYELKNAKLFYFCGGGYLTGRTLSRLWDGILICKLADIFKTPVVMSGQTIGLWQNIFNKVLAKSGFKKVRVIAVRDKEESISELAKIGLKSKSIFWTHDDALFCRKNEKRLIEDKRYITVNFHYWGMNDKQKKLNIDKLNKIIQYIIENNDCKLIFIPMTKSDEKSYYDYINKYPNDRFVLYKYDYDFRKIRRVIADSEICITMKHHPIIFAMGEKVPVISLVFSDYYLHKNVGALRQYGQEKYNVNIENNKYFEQFVSLYKTVLSNKNTIVSEIDNNLSVLKQQKEKFLAEVDKILN